MQGKEHIEGQQHTDLPDVNLPQEDLQAVEESKQEQIKEFAKQHPFRLDTREERLFPGKYRSR